MITIIRICRKCGARIFSDAPEGLCSRCVLKIALATLPEALVATGDSSAVALAKADGAGSVENLAATPHDKKTVRAARLLGELGDYELLEEVGRGGQGVVFRARQKSLNRTVAIKVIGLGQWATEAHLKRFRREAEAAARLEHPCIVPIHEVGEREGSCYFSMNFVDGGQLDQVIGREPLPIGRAVELIAKLARAIHYAHEHGILHRDIKPGNILLDQKGEPHLTDFGLARLVETESTITRTKEVLGTPSYMAPEQAVGETGKLTSATDVYGLGAVLYQLLTGQPPFAGGTTYETVKLLLETEPRRPRLLNPKVDRDLSAICLKCLEKDPNRRYSSALALAEDLEHWLKHEPILAKPSGFFTHTRKWVRRNPSTTMLLTLLVALGVGLSVTIWNRKPTVIIPKSIAVLPFENLGPDPNNAYFADGMQEEILTRLASIADLKVISRTSTQSYQSKPHNLSQIAKQLGVANILEGSVQKAGDQVRVNVQLINAQTDSHLWAETYDRKLTDILGVETEIAKGIAETLETKLTGREKQALAVKATSNPAAYDAYLRGLAFDARNYANVWSDDYAGKAVSSYERAVYLDPKFATAWARLSRAQALIYKITGLGGDATKLALDNAQKLAPNTPETVLAFGYYQDWVLRDHGAAETTFGRVSKMLPGSSDVLLALSRVTRDQEHWDQAIAYSEQAIALDPRNVELLMEAAITYAELRQFPRALKLYDRALDISPTDPDVMASKAAIYHAQGNLQEAGKLLAKISWQTPNPNTFKAKVVQLTLERNYGEIIRLLKTPESQKGERQMWLADAQRLAGDAVGARLTAEKTRNKLERLYKGQPNDLLFASYLAEVYALMGEKDLALKAAERSIMLAESPLGVRTDGLPSLFQTGTPRAASLREHLAGILTMVGENSRAISILGELLQEPYWSYFYGPPAITPAVLRLDPLWDPLRGDPAFQKLCEEKQAVAAPNTSPGVPLSGRAASCVPPPPGMVSWWLGNGKTDDIIGSNNGTLHNGATFVPGIVDQAFSFDGEDDYVQARDTQLPSGSAARTLDFWMKPTNNARVPVLYGGYRENDAFYVLVCGPNACIGQWGGGDVCGFADVTDGSWHHVALTYDGGSSVVLYVDGALDTAATKTYRTTQTGKLYIGSTVEGSNEYFKGLVDEVDIFNRALSETEIQSIVNAGSAGKCKPTPIILSASESKVED